MKRLSHMLMVIGLLLVGCSDNVFTDGPSQNENKTIFLDGDGGSASLSIPIKDLQSITLFHNDEKSDRSTKYYRSGKVAVSSDTPASEISSIVFDNDISRLEITKNGKKFSFNSICNASNAEECFTLLLTYDYGVKTVTIRTEAGRTLHLDYVILGQLMINDSVFTKSKLIDYDNQLEEKQTIMNYPYEDELFTVSIDPLEYYWLRNLSLTMYVPAFRNGKWLSEKVSGVVPGMDYQDLTWFHNSVCYQIHIPAHVSGYIQNDMKYANASAPCDFRFRNEILDRIVTANCNISSTWPTKVTVTRYDSDGTVITFDHL